MGLSILEKRNFISAECGGVPEEAGIIVFTPLDLSGIYWYLSGDNVVLIQVQSGYNLANSGLSSLEANLDLLTLHKMFS